MMAERSTSSGPSMRAVALHYAGAGWHVFPLRPRQKTPLTEHGCLDATKDKAKITEWWQRWPTANVGIATGANSGLLVVDIDGEDGELALAELVAAHGPLPLVPEVRTGRGRHLYFAFDERVKNSAKRLAKIDTRSTGGYVVAPPSVHPSGDLYEWAHDAGPRRRAIVAAPEWLLEQFMARKASPATSTQRELVPAPRPSDGGDRYRAWCLHAVEKESAELAREREGSRGSALNRAAYKLGGYLATGLVTEGDIERSLVDASTANGLVEKDGIDSVRSTIRRGLEAGRKQPRDIPRLEDRPDSRIAHPAPPGRNARRHVSDPQDPGGGDVPPPTDDDFQGPSGPSDDELPVIFDTFDEDETVALADRYLAPDPELYQRGGMLVQVLTDRSPGAGLVRSHQHPKIVQLDVSYLRTLSTRRVRWMRRVLKDGEWEEVRIRPPRHAIAALHTRRHWTHVRKLEGVTTTPLFRHDGEVLTRPGFDADTGVLLEPHETFPEVATRPSRQDVEDSIESLRYVVGDFPFESAAHEATFFAAVLTPLARYAFRGPAPLFMIDANTQGTGKGLLARVIGLISIGAPPKIIVTSRDDAEEHKRITTVAMDADQLVCIDNIEGRWGSAAMCAALTTDEWSARVLGGQSSYTGPLLTTWLATANNVMLTTDMVRRVAHIRLVTKEERPEQRTGFAIPGLEEHVRRHRPKLVHAALTILRGWHVAGRPHQAIPNWGSFDGWSSVVRQALVWAGLRDPVETQSSLRDAADTDRDQLMELIEGLVAVYDGNRLTAGEILLKARGDHGHAHVLKEALEAYTNGRTVTSKLIARLLLRARGRIADGRRIQGERSSHRKQWVWWVETTDGKEVSSGLSFE